ncbi:MAG: SAM-dependent methyltransferase, partial [Alphaproteobacteria bacterium]
VLILPWNLKREIMDQLGHLAARGTRFVTAIPRLQIAAPAVAGG